MQQTASAPLPARFGLAVVAAFAFALTNTFSRGAYSEHALQFVVLALLVLVGAFAVGLRKRPDALLSTGATLGLVWAGLFMMQWNAWNDPSIVIYAQREWSTGRTVEVCSMLLLATYLPALYLGKSEPRIARDARIALFAALVLMGGVATYHVSPRPAIDVWTVQQAGADALLRGANPFTATAVTDTAPGVARDNVPYVYPPMQIYLTLPAYALFKDVRYTMLAAVIVAGLAMRGIAKRSGRELPALAEDAALLALWLSPKLFFILEQAWIDPAQIALICAATWLQLRRPGVASAILWGVVFAAKQTMFWLIPLAGFTFRFRLRDWIIAGATTVAAYLPFMVWDFAAWKYSNFDFLTGLPARNDALSLTNWAQRKFGEPLTGRAAFPMTAIVVALSSWRDRGAPQRFGVALAAAYTIFFIFNKWAFANYYYSLLGLSCLAAALAFHEPAAEASATTPA